MRNTNHTKSINQSFDQIIFSRLVADDFAQPQAQDADFYKSKAVTQIRSAITAIRSATNKHDFTAAIAQANAFIDAAQDYEFIDLSEKANWLNKVADAVRVQTIGESA